MKLLYAVQLPKLSTTAHQWLAIAALHVKRSVQALSWTLELQRQSFGDVLQNIYFQACNFIKKKLPHRCFPEYIFKNNFFTEHLWWLLLEFLIFEKSLTRFHPKKRKRKKHSALVLCVEHLFPEELNMLYQLLKATEEKHSLITSKN